MIDDLAGFDAPIDGRAKQSAAERERGKMWRAGVRRYQERWREEHLDEWRGFHEHMCRLHVGRRVAKGGEG